MLLSWEACSSLVHSQPFIAQVIRHRKMIHKINEPKFEPEVHDSRSQTGKRPPPLPVPAESQPQKRVQSPQFPSENRPTFPSLAPSQSYSNHNQPAIAQTLAEAPPRAIGPPVNPFNQTYKPDSVSSAIKNDEHSNTFTSEMEIKPVAMETSSR